MDRPRTPRRRLEAPEAPTTLHEITRRYYATALALAKAMGLPLTEQFILQHRESISTCFIESSRAGIRLAGTVQLPPLTEGAHVADAPVATNNTQRNVTPNVSDQRGSFAPNVLDKSGNRAPVTPNVSDKTATFAPNVSDEDAHVAHNIAQSSPTDVTGDANNVAHNVAQSSPTDVTGDANVAHHATQSSPNGQPEFSGALPKNSSTGQPEPEVPDCTGLVPPPDRVPTDAGLPCKGQLIVDLRPASLSMLINKVKALAEAQGGQWEVLLTALTMERERRLANGATQRANGHVRAPAEADGDGC
jgi:hypothetical protein